MDKKYTIGKARDNYIIYNNLLVSSKHAVLEQKPSGWFITDISTNGTTVNGKAIPKNFKIPISSKDKIVFAGVESFNWNSVGAKPKVRISIRSALISISILVIIPIIFFIKDIPFINGNFIAGEITFEEINTKYEKAIVLIYHSFLYKIDLPSRRDDIYITRNNEKRLKVGINPNELSPIAITGTGFFVGEKGKVVTNRHVVAPWFEEEETKENETLKAIKNSDFYHQILTLTSQSFTPKIEGKSVLIGIALNNTEFVGESSVIKCKVIEIADNKKLDIAIIQTKTLRVPDKASFISIELINKDDSIVKASEACIIGFPEGLAVAYTGNIIEATFKAGRISQVSDIYKIQYDIPTSSGTSGAPIFNNKGKVIAVNFSGLPPPGNINYGIKSKYVHDILD